MKSKLKAGPRPFQLKLLGYGTCYYIKRVARLEAALARKPRTLQIELIGAGEIPADLALLLRSVLIARSPKTRLISHARSSLHNGAVLVWLLGDTRLIRDDARVFFRRAKLDEDAEPELQHAWADEPKYCDSYSELEPEEGDHARVLALINEYLPVRELVGRLVEMPVLRQFGLVEHEQVDHFLATAFAKAQEHADDPANAPRKKRTPASAKASRARTIRR